jgi:hypothetical protein
MHECPECGQACDCDQDDVWMDDLQTMLHCSHECEQFDDDDDSGYQDFLDDREEVEPSANRDAVELSVEQTGTGLTVTETSTSEGQAKKICHYCAAKLTCTWQPDNAKECHFFSPASTLSD